jgi:hypothetical protein
MATLMARFFGNKLGLDGISEDGFEDNCSGGIGDGSLHSDKLDIDEGSKDGFEDGPLLGVKLGMDEGRRVIEMASKMAAEIASKTDLLLLVARLTKVLKKANGSSLGVMLGINEGTLGGFNDGCSDGIEDGASPCDKLGFHEAAEVAI